MVVYAIGLRELAPSDGTVEEWAFPWTLGRLGGSHHDSRGWASWPSRGKRSVGDPGNDYVQAWPEFRQDVMLSGPLVSAKAGWQQCGERDPHTPGGGDTITLTRWNLRWAGIAAPDIYIWHTPGEHEEEQKWQGKWAYHR